jgi:hypothetical protein
MFANLPTYLVDEMGRKKIDGTLYIENERKRKVSPLILYSREERFVSAEAPNSLNKSALQTKLKRVLNISSILLDDLLQKKEGHPEKDDGALDALRSQDAPNNRGRWPQTG